MGKKGKRRKRLSPQDRKRYEAQDRAEAAREAAAADPGDWLHIDQANLGGNILKNASMYGRRASLVLGGDESGTDTPPPGHTDVWVKGRWDDPLYMDAQSRSNTFLYGGEIESLDGRIEHHPRNKSFGGYSSAGASKECACGFVAHAFTKRCPKCSRLFANGQDPDRDS